MSQTSHKKMAYAPDDRPLSPESSPRWRGSILSAYWLFVASLAMAYHCGAATASLIPKKSALRTVVLPAFESYNKVTGTRQGWGMFNTIPWDEDYDVRVMATTWDGKDCEYGFVLPGLREKNDHERIHKLFNTLGKDNYSIYRDAYLANLGKRIAELVPETTQYEVHFISHRMWGLKKIAEKGKISREVKTTYGPFEIVPPPNEEETF